MRYALMFAWSLLIGGTLSAAEPATEKKDAASEKWVSLFNGKDLTGWTPKISLPTVGRELEEHVPRRRRPAQSALRSI